MFKVPLLLILCFFIVGAEARTPYKHADFVHLSDTEKDRFIIKVMELVVELEGKYEKEITSTHPDQKKIEKYTQLLKQFKSLLMAEAHAAKAVPVARSPRDFEKIADDFTNLMKKPDVCIYAGWISRMSLKGTKLADGTVTKKSICVHPNHINDGVNATRYPPETMAYATSSDCLGKNKITCNPALFGYKKQSDNTLFCVDAGVTSRGVNQADNSALYCMREALSEKESAEQDSVSTRLGFLRKALSEKPAIFEGVQQLVFKSCLCTDPKNNFNKDYLKYMQPHQTCYGMMEMMAETVTCEDPKFAMDTTIFEQIRNHAEGKFDRMTSSPSQVRDYYSNYVVNLQKNSPQEYTQYCGGTPLTVTPPEEHEEEKPEDPKPNVYVCQRAICTNGTGDEISCEYSVTDSDGNSVEFKETSKEITKEPLAVKIKGTVGESAELQLDCTAEMKAEEITPTEVAKPTLEVTRSDNDVKSYKVIAKISEPNDGWNFNWSIEGSGDFKPIEGWKKATTTPAIQVAGLPEEGSEEGEATTPAVHRDQLEIIQNRGTVKYQVCGEISKGDEKDKKCVDIDLLTPTTAKPAKKGSGGMGAMPNNQQPPQIRGTSDTSAVGIK